MILSDVAIKNRTTVMVMVVMIIIMGTMSYVSLPRESAPDVKVPYIIITTVNPGAAPEDIESTITTKIENQLTGLKGKKEITSVSSEGVSTITVEFMPDIDIDDALQRVKNKVDLAKPELPKDTDEPIDPVVMEISFADMPIMAVNISGDISPAHMKDIAETLEEEIEAVPGVLGVDVMGALEREIILEIDPDKVAQYGLTITELMKFIPSENVSMTAGGLETTGMKLSVRIPGKFDDPSQINRLPIAVRSGKPIYLTDVAKTMDTFKDTESFSRLDGENSVTLNIKKRVGANIIDIAKHVKAILKVAETMVPKGVIFTLTTDRSKEINLMVADLENNIFTSLILVVAVLMIFMGLRSSLIVATIIPLSMLMSFAVLQALGITLNMVVLFSLILALGMLVDNAIVIVENIYRFMEMGYEKKEAAMKATSEVAWPVISSTATTVAAFTPLLFWPGIMGDFMSYLPLTVIIVLTCSLIVAMMINPVICSIWGKPQQIKGKDHKQHLFVEKYRALLNFVLQRPGMTLFLSFCLLIAIIVIYGRSGLGVELFPMSDPKEGIISIRLPQGTNVKETDRLAGIIEKRVEKFRKSDKPGQIDNFKNVVTNVGTSGGSTSGGGSSDSGPHTASLTLVFPDYEERVKSSASVINDVRKELEDFPGAEVKVERRKDGPPTGAAVTIRIIGEDMGVLQKLSEEVSQRIKGTPNMVNMRSDLEAAKPELVFVPDRVQSAIMETDTNSISQFLKTAIYGTKVGEYQQFNDDYDIRLRPEVSKRRGVDDLLKLRVPTLNGGAVPLTSLGHFEYKPGLGTIHRIDRKRVVTVTADAEGRTGLEVLADAQKRLTEMKLPTGYRIEYAGEKEEDDKARNFLSKAFLIALLLIVAILVMQFNTLSVPLIIMSTVILSLIGVFIGLLVFQQPFGVIMTGVGVISLAGVVVNNAIVLLDYTRQLQQRGYSLQDAAVEAGVTRLRPVLLTAGTTVLGLVPMVTGISFDFHTMSIAWKSSSTQWWSNMAVAVIFGLSFATMLTLLVVPSLYVLTSKIAIKWGMNTAPQVHHKPKPNMEDF